MNIIEIKNPPQYIGKTMYSKDFASNNDIIKTIQNALPGAIKQSKNIALDFKGDTILQSCQNIWNYLKYKIEYEKDDDDFQIIKYPSKLINDGFGDCKSYALFAASILSNLGIPYVIRYINQSGGTIPRHVYVVAFDKQENEIIVDAVYSRFNAEPPNIKYKKDFNYNTMNVSAIAGIKKSGNSLGDFLNEKIAGIYGIGDLFDQIADQATYLGADVVAPGSGEVLRVAGGATGQTPSSFVQKFNPFGAPAVSVKPNTLFEIDHQNSSNLYELVFWLFEPYNKPEYGPTASQKISNAYAFDHMTGATLNALKTISKQTGTDQDIYTNYTYACLTLWNTFGGDYSGFITKLDTVFPSYTDIKEGRFLFYKDIQTLGFEKALAKLGLSLSGSQTTTPSNTGTNTNPGTNINPGTTNKTSGNNILPSSNTNYYLIGGGVLAAGIIGYFLIKRK